MIMLPLRALVVLSLISVCLCTTEYGYICKDGSCESQNRTNGFVEYTTPETAMSLRSCQFFCNEFSGIWPEPTGKTIIGKTLVRINPHSIKVNYVDLLEYKENQTFIKEVVNDFLGKCTKDINKTRFYTGGVALVVKVDVRVMPKPLRFPLTAHEDYVIYTQHMSSREIRIKNLCDSYFGCLRGLQTIQQLLIYDNFLDGLFMPANISITDAPVFPYRGITLRGLKNSIDKQSIKSIIDSMAAVKLNTLHWRIFDDQTLPYIEVKQVLDKTRIDPSRAWTETDIKEVVSYGMNRGIRILPEIYIPNHMRRLQYYMELLDMNETNTIYLKKMYSHLESLYHHLLHDFRLEVFHLADIFHTWVRRKYPNLNDWIKYQDPTTPEGAKFTNLWIETLNSTYEKLLLANNYTRISAIVKNSGQNFSLLNPENFIIQWREDSDNKNIKEFLQNNFRVILANEDLLEYSQDENTSSKVYETSPFTILKTHNINSDREHLILGSVAIVLVSNITQALDQWRASNFFELWGERMWSNPSMKWIDAKKRLSTYKFNAL